MRWRHFRVDCHSVRYTPRDSASVIAYFTQRNIRNNIHSSQTAFECVSEMPLPAHERQGKRSLVSEDALFAHETNEYSGLVSRWPVPAHGLVLQIEVELDGAVVGAEDLGVDLGGCDLVFEGVGDEEVVQPPSDVLLAGVEAVRPPGIFHLVRVL